MSHNSLPEFDGLQSLTADDIPRALQLIPLIDAAKLLGVQQRKLLQLLEHHQLPVIQISARKRSVLAPHLAELIAAHARHVERA